MLSVRIHGQGVGEPERGCLFEAVQHGGALPQFFRIQHPKTGFGGGQRREPRGGIIGAPVDHDPYRVPAVQRGADGLVHLGARVVARIPEDHKAIAEKAYQDIVDQMCDLDEEVGMMFLEEKPITKEHLKAAIRRQTIANRFVPVAGGSAFKNKGVQYLVDAVVDYLPSPVDILPAKGQDPGDGAPMEAAANDNAKFCSLAFKLWSDPFVGKLVFFRVYSGKLSKGDTVYNPRTNKRERIHRLHPNSGRQARGYRHVLLRRYRRDRWDQEHHDR